MAVTICLSVSTDHNLDEAECELHACSRECMSRNDILDKLPHSRAFPKMANGDQPTLFVPFS